MAAWEECFHVWKTTEKKKAASEGRNTMIRIPECFRTRSAAYKALNRKVPPSTRWEMELLENGKPDAMVRRCQYRCGCRMPVGPQSRRRPCPALGGEPAPEF